MSTAITYSIPYTMVLFQALVGEDLNWYPPYSQGWYRRNDYWCNFWLDSGSSGELVVTIDLPVADKKSSTFKRNLPSI